MKNYVAYYRVSTIKQGFSGLGLEAQREAIQRFLGNAPIIAEYTEIESGSKNNRAELDKAILHAKNDSATLVIAKLDRLSRNVSFIFALRDAKVDFICADMPDANTMTIGIFAVLAQHERELISYRTKAALQAKKAQGYTLGKPQNLTYDARKKGSEIKFVYIVDVEARNVDRLLQRFNKVFRYAVGTKRCERNPAADLDSDVLQPVKVKHRSAITDPVAVGALMRAIHGYTGQFVTLCALKLAPLVFVRPEELRGAQWCEFDLDGAVWTIPPQRRKLTRKDRDDPTTPPHIVPLCAQAVVILRELHALTGRRALLFPSLRTSERPISENTINAALRRMGYTMDEMTHHGFRALASTRLNEMGFGPDVIERQLSHAEKDQVRAAYNRAAYMDERRKMMQAWADYLDALRVGASVVAIRSKA